MSASFPFPPTVIFLFLENYFSNFSHQPEELIDRVSTPTVGWSMLLVVLVQQIKLNMNHLVLTYWRSYNLKTPVIVAVELLEKISQPSFLVVINQSSYHYHTRPNNLTDFCKKKLCSPLALSLVKCCNYFYCH